MKENKGKVLIIGLGYVGLTLAVHLCRNGYEIYGVEIDKKILDNISKGKAHFYEPGIDALVHEFINKKLFVSGFVPNLKYDVIIISVGTPLYLGKNIVNMEYLKSSLDSIYPVYDKSSLLVLRSTVEVGTTRNYVLPIIKGWSRIDDDEILLSFCPERTAEGVALLELETLPQLISGYNKKSLEVSRKFFSNFSSEVYVCPSLEASELVKLFNNVYRDINFAVGNILNNISQSFGIDGYEMIELSNKEYNRSKIAKPGFVGGACLEKDAYILANNLKLKEEKNNIISFRIFNENLEKDVVYWVNNQIKKGSSLLISGLAFKGQPPTSDLRGSNPIKILKQLIDEYDIIIHDYHASYSDLVNIDKRIKVVKTFNDIKKKVDLIMLLNNTVEYHSINNAILSKIIKSSGQIFDAWSMIPSNIIIDYPITTLGNYKIGKN